MRKWGWGLFIGHLIDVLFSVAATLVSALEGASNLFSMVIMLYTVIMLIFAVMGRVRPRRPFIVISVFGAFMLVFGIYVAVALLMECGPEVFSGHMTIQDMGGLLPWYWAFHWSMLGCWLVLAVATLADFVLNKPAPPPIPQHYS
jgi:hypothetical protein